MRALLSSPWSGFVQALLLITGTWLLAFGLKSVGEAKGFDRVIPHPQPWRFIAGLVLLTAACTPQLLQPFVDPENSSDVPTSGDVSPQRETAGQTNWDRMRQCAEQADRLADLVHAG